MMGNKNVLARSQTHIIDSRQQGFAGRSTSSIERYRPFLDGPAALKHPFQVQKRFSEVDYKTAITPEA